MTSRDDMRQLAYRLFFSRKRGTHRGGRGVGNVWAAIKHFLNLFYLTLTENVIRGKMWGCFEKAFLKAKLGAWGRHDGPVFSILKGIRKEASRGPAISITAGEYRLVIFDEVAPLRPKLLLKLAVKFYKTHNKPQSSLTKAPIGNATTRKMSISSCFSVGCVLCDAYSSTGGWGGGV